MTVETRLTALENRLTKVEDHIWPVTTKHRTRLGINVDPNHPHITAEEVVKVGARMARFPLWADAKFDPFESGTFYHYFADKLSRVYGIDSLYVLDSRSWKGSYPNWGFLPGRYFQMGNEPDIVSSSSGTQTQQEFSDDLAWARTWLDTYSSTKLKRYIIAGGLASGQAWWLNKVDLSPVDAIAVHPYGQRADGYPNKSWGHGELRDLIRRYKEVTDKPIWITEFGTQDYEMSQEQQAEYIHRCLSIMDEEGIVSGLWYCLDEAMSDQYDLDVGPAREAFVDEAKVRD